MAHLQMRFALIAACLMAVTTGYVLREEENPDIHLNTPELISKYGYPVEIHTVTTEDGYILELHRIPHGKGETPSPRPAILVQHGLLSSSADWVVMGPGKGFGYILADAGYDVWLGNARGNTYTRKHQSIDPNDKEFWQFSWHEMGVYDMPATIDYIIKESGQEKIFYAGHSMGTTMFYVMMSQRPEYNDKITAMFSLAPIAFMEHMASPLIRIISDIGDMFDWLLELMGGFEFLPNSELLTMMGQLACNEEAITSALCSNALFLLCGFDSEQLNTTMMPVILAHTPAGAASMSLLHYSQSHQSGKFRQYDHGAIENLIIYGQLSPPEYDLYKVTAPIFLHYSDNDWFAAIEDVDILHSQLPNAQKLRVTFPKFNHLDYLWAIDADSLVYNKVISLMNGYA